MYRYEKRQQRNKPVKIKKVKTQSSYPDNKRDKKMQHQPLRGKCK